MKYYHSPEFLIVSRATAVVGFALALATGAFAAGKPASKQVLGPYSTWDADMINAEVLHACGYTGEGVYVAVLDTGLVPNWRDYFPEDRIATKLGKGFHQPVTFKAGKDPCGYEVEVGRLRESTWVGSVGSTHGTHVTSTILGYNYRSNSDLYLGYPLPPIFVQGIAPDVTVIPVKVLGDYQVPALPLCSDPGPMPSQKAVFGTSEMVAAGIHYATDLAIAGYRPMVINMSLGGPALDEVEQLALDRAIANGVIVVASAGNEGLYGMGYPGAYPPVISVGSVGWTKEWWWAVNVGDKEYVIPPSDIGIRNRLWWLQVPNPWWLQAPEPLSGSWLDVTEDPLALAAEVYVSDFSSRALGVQELDVLAPGSWVRGPLPGYPGYAHLPWWSRGLGDLISRGNPGNFYYVGGTSMASPHVASVAALLLQQQGDLNQGEVETLLKSSALPIEPDGSRLVYDFTFDGTQEPVEVTWSSADDVDPVGAGLVQADAALTALGGSLCP